MDAGGDGHHFRVIQLPYNLSLQDAATINSQIVKGKRMSLLSAAQKLGISVVASASLMQVRFKMDFCILSVVMIIMNNLFPVSLKKFS